VVPNAFGVIVLPHIEAVFAELDRIGDDIAAARNGLAGMLSVGGTMTVLPYLLPQSLMVLRRSDPGMAIRVIEGTVDQMARALAQNEVDLVLGRVLGTPARYDFTHEILFEDPFVPVVAARHPLARAKHPVGDMSRYGWILPPEGSSAREPLERYMLRNNIRPKERMIETVSFQVTMSLLEASDAIAVLPLHLARLGVARRNIKIVGTEIGGGSLPIGVTHRSERPPPLAKALITAFREIIAAVAMTRSPVLLTTL
jgi:DNA-binding transcriptional LysR family regulator